MIGSTISHYRIEAQLGRGGMGVVYRAHDRVLRRDVALKVLSEEIAGHADRRSRLLAEARAASALNHPGITTVYEVGEDGERVFIVMELVPGSTARELISKGPVEPKTVVRLGVQVAEALAAAHAQGIVHGDVKPENIVVQPDGRVKLLDFGIARQIAAESLTRASTSATPLDAATMGTLAYMAPEQLRGGTCDARADLFALGVVLYELAAGRQPFPGPTAAAVMAQILNEAPPALAVASLLVPSQLARITHKLLEKDPASRYPSAREVQVDLTNLGRDLELGSALPPTVAGKRALAVLPFKLLTPNPEDDYLSVALADAVISELSSSGDLLVRPTSTVMRYTKQAVDPLVAARELNVQVVVDGSIQKFGQKLRVHVQAWNASDGSTLLSTKHDSELVDLFGLQDRIAENLGRALGSKPASATAEAAPPTKNSTAYELFLRAAERLSRLNKWDTRTAIEMLETAVQLDPRFSDAWARLAEAYLVMAISFDPRPEWIRRAERAIRRALGLDSNNPDAHCARGRLLWSPARGFQHRPALRALGQALHLNPGCHQAQLWKGVIFNHVGLLDQANEEITAALATDPDDPYTLNQAGQLATYRGDYDAAQHYYARALTLDPSHLWATLFSPMAPLYAGNLQRAEERVRIAVQAAPKDHLALSWEALLWAKRGEVRKTEQAVQRALRDRRLLTYTHHAWHHLAAAFAVIGKPVRAVAFLRRAVASGLPNYPVFRDDPHFRPLEKHPQFRRLIADLKREWTSYQREFGQR